MVKFYEDYLNQDYQLILEMVSFFTHEGVLYVWFLNDQIFVCLVRIDKVESPWANTMSLNKQILLPLFENQVTEVNYLQM